MDKFLDPNANKQRLLEEYIRYGSLVVGFDFDQTVYDPYNQGDKHDMVIQLLKDLKSIGCKLICWTATSNPTFAVEFLDKNQIPFDGINTEGIELPWKCRKPFFSSLLDDRAGLLQAYNDLREVCDYIMIANDSKLSSFENQSTEQ